MSKLSGQTCRNSAAWRSKAQRDACVDQIFNLDLRGALAFYGVDFSRGGKVALCPFHDETDASFAVKDNRYWHCFGCNESGGLIRFVSKRYRISTSQAIEKIAHDFKLGAIGGTSQAKQLAISDTAEVKRRIREKAMQKVEADYLDALTAYMDADDALTRAYGVDPFSVELSNAYWTMHKARYILEEAELMRSEVYARR